MKRQVLVCVCGGVDDLQEQFDARMQPQPVRVAIGVKGLACQCFQHMVRFAIRGEALPQNTRQVRVIKIETGRLFLYESDGDFLRIVKALGFEARLPGQD